MSNGRLQWILAVIAALLLMYGVPFTLMTFNNGNQAAYISGLVASGVGMFLILVGLVASAIKKDSVGYEVGSGLKHQLSAVYGAIALIGIAVGFPVAITNIGKEDRLVIFGAILGGVGLFLLLLEAVILLVKGRNRKGD